jgi:hypothetical protein
MAEVSIHTDNDGNPSWMRAAGTVCLAVGLTMALMETAGHLIFDRAVDGNAVSMVGVCLGFAFGGKVSQKFAEK